MATTMANGIFKGGIVWLLAVLIVSLEATGADIRSGTVHAKDADSWFFVEPHPTKPGRTRHFQVRPSGIDAPELTQPCQRDGKIWYAGWDAGLWLVKFLAGKEVTCIPTGAWTFGRAVANCTVNGKDLQEIIVRAGWAFDWPKFSGGKYEAAEDEARRARRGVHSGVCEKPWLWRRKNY